MPPLIAVVDDIEYARTVCAALAEQAGYRTAAFTDGQDFLDRYRPEPGCVVLDMVMRPGLGGLDALTEMAARNWTVPVIGMSGHPHFRHEACNLGAFAFIDKPFLVLPYLKLLAEAVAEDARRRRWSASSTS